MWTRIDILTSSFDKREIGSLVVGSQVGDCNCYIDIYVFIVTRRSRAHSGSQKIQGRKKKEIREARNTVGWSGILLLLVKIYAQTSPKSY